jgi:hypothetical protein
MKGDFSRITYNDRKHYSLVLMQQGRVQLDSDWNEQALLHWFGLQNLAKDLIGEHGGPPNKLGFAITNRADDNSAVITSDFTINEGRYYVHGVMCENETAVAYTEQDAYPLPDSAMINNGKKYVVYLHVWWRHITNIEDDDIREVALGGPDTASRIQTVWQVKMVEVTPADVKDFKKNYGLFINLLEKKGIIKPTTESLQARVLKPSDSDQPCITSPQSRYRGNENQLYRVEIHRSGPACNLEAPTTNVTCATFTWSRENGSVVFPILDLSGETVTLEHFCRDDRFGLKAGDWVEVVDDSYEFQHRAEALCKVTAVDPNTLQVTLSARPQHAIDLSKHPLLRRWDHAGETLIEGAVPVEEGRWIELEDGVQIRFPIPASEDKETHFYQSGAWWWIPARTATGDVEWPQDRNTDEPLAREPFDAGHRYAPLAFIEVNGSGKVEIKNDYKRTFKQLWE